MRLSVREQRQLDIIGEAVSRPHAQLASMLASFGRLYGGEPTPGRGQLTKPPSRAGRACWAAGAVIAGFVRWLDCVNLPITDPAPPGRAHHPVSRR